METVFEKLAKGDSEDLNGALGALADLHKAEVPAAGDMSMAWKTAMLHQHWVQQYGEMPALAMYYAYLVPHLLKDAEPQGNAMMKAESMVIGLSKALSEASDAGKRHGIAVGGGQKFEVLREGPDHFVAKGKEGLVKLPKSKQGSHWDLKQPLRHDAKPAVVDASSHGTTGLCDGQEQINLMQGLDLAAHDHTRSGWVESKRGPVFLRCEPVEKGWSAAKNEVAFYNAARDVFDLGQYVPVAAGFHHPQHTHDVAAIASIPMAEHMDTDDQGWARGPHGQVLKQLGDSGELDKLMLMDMVMGTNRTDHNCLFTFHSEPHLRLTDHGDLDGLAMRWPVRMDQPAYMAHYAQDWPGRPLHPAAHQWLAQVDMERLEKSLQRSGMPAKQRNEAVRRLVEAKAHSKTMGSTATKGSTYMAPWASFGSK